MAGQRRLDARHHLMPIHRRELRELIRDLRRIPREVREELRPAVLAAGGIVAEEARRNADWSTRIPDAIWVSSRFSGGSTAGVRVAVNVRKAPHAPLYEGPPRVFHHSLFGNRRHWYPEAARPFLQPALVSKADEAAEVVDDAVAHVLARHGFR